MPSADLNDGQRNQEEHDERAENILGGIGGLDVGMFKGEKKKEKDKENLSKKQKVPIGKSMQFDIQKILRFLLGSRKATIKNRAKMTDGSFSIKARGSKDRWINFCVFDNGSFGVRGGETSENSGRKLLITFNNAFCAFTEQELFSISRTVTERPSSRRRVVTIRTKSFIFSVNDYGEINMKYI